MPIYRTTKLEIWCDACKENKAMISCGEDETVIQALRNDPIMDDWLVYVCEPDGPLAEIREVLNNDTFLICPSCFNRLRDINKPRNVHKAVFMLLVAYEQFRRAKDEDKKE